MDLMISHDLLQIASNKLEHEHWEVREQAAILLS